MLERVLQRLPGMHAERAASLLGVRPMERAEAMARVLRCESTVWEVPPTAIRTPALSPSPRLSRDSQPEAEIDSWSAA